MTKVPVELLRRWAAETPGAPFLNAGAGWLTCAELSEATDRVAGGLAALGVRPGDRVAILLPNRPEYPELCLGCMRLGAVQVPLNAYLKGEFLRHQLADCGAGVLVTDAPGLKAASPLLASTAIRRIVLLDNPDDADRPVVAYAEVRHSTSPPPDTPLQPSDVASIMYTSGTTGLPKGCMLSHGYYATIAETFFTCGTFERGERIFTAVPMFHTSGHIVLAAALTGPTSLVIEPVFSASTFLARAAAEQANMLWGVGPMGVALLRRPADPRDGQYSFRLANWVPMCPEDQIAFAERFGTPVTGEAYGQTECVPSIISSVNGPRRPGTAGRAAPHVEVRIVDDDDRAVPDGQVGEIAIRPKVPYATFSGYWNNPAGTVEAWRNLWHHTGDLGRQDGDGFITFVDRKKDALRRRGENVSSFEVEAAIATHPAVSQVAVCGVPSPLGEDDIRACVVLHDSARLDPDEFFGFLKGALPYFAVPRYITICDQLPTNAVGRVMKHVLRAQGVPEGTWDFEARGLTVGRDERRS